MPRPYSSGEYHRNRRTLLEGGATCAIAGPGCTLVATTADHVVPLTAGGDDSLTNLRPACAMCNNMLGGRIGRAKQLARRPVEDGSLERHPSSLSPDSRRISGRNTRSQAPNALTISDVPTSGRIDPRLHVSTVGDDSLGPLVTKWAAANMPFPLMAWNEHVLDGLLATGDGRLVHRQGLISVGRQNSKTSMAIALAGWWLTDLADRIGPQVAVWMAHDLRLSELAFFQLARMLDQRTLRTSSSYGRQRLELDNGSRFHVVASTLGAGHGLSIDLAVVDEIWRVSPEAVDHGIAPAQRARPQPLMVMLSTAGDEQSLLLKQWRERGMAMIETATPGRLYFAEWSPPPAVDYADPAWWPWANPALGTTIDRQTLLDEFNGPNRAAFLRSALNLWVQSEASWLAPGQWDRCRSRKMPEPGRGVVAVEVAQGGDRFYAVRAWMHNGVAHVAPLTVTEHEDDLWATVDAVWGELDQLLVTPSLQARVPPAWQRRTTMVGTRELARSVPILRAMIAAGQVAHDGSQLLAEHVGRAIATRAAGLSTSLSGAIELARTMVWAVAAVSRPSPSRRPAMGFAST